LLKMVLVIDEWGGARVGKGYSSSWYISFLGSRLEATGSGLSLRLLWKRYAFEKAEVSALRRYDSMFLGKGIQIIHSNPECPSYMVFYGGSRRESNP
jgi:hypothetical protein